MTTFKSASHVRFAHLLVALSLVLAAIAISPVPVVAQGGDSDLSKQLSQLQAQVTRLEAALNHQPQAAAPMTQQPTAEGNQATVQEQRIPGVPEGMRITAGYQNCIQCHQTRPTGPLPPTHLEALSGGGQGGSQAASGSGQGGAEAASGQESSGAGMGQMAQGGKGMQGMDGGGMGGNGMGMGGGKEMGMGMMGGGMGMGGDKKKGMGGGGMGGKSPDENAAGGGGSTETSSANPAEPQLQQMQQQIQQMQQQMQQMMQMQMQMQLIQMKMMQAN